jgi:hypothetical protein
VNGKVFGWHFAEFVSDFGERFFGDACVRVWEWTVALEELLKRENMKLKIVSWVV